MDGANIDFLLTIYVYVHVCRRSETFEVYAAEIQEKSASDVEKYYDTFEKKWRTLAGTSFSFSLSSTLIDDSSGDLRGTKNRGPHIRR